MDRVTQLEMNPAPDGYDFNSLQLKFGASRIRTKAHSVITVGPLVIKDDVQVDINGLAVDAVINAEIFKLNQSVWNDFQLGQIVELPCIAEILNNVSSSYFKSTIRNIYISPIKGIALPVFSQIKGAILNKLTKGVDALFNEVVPAFLEDQRQNHTCAPFPYPGEVEPFVSFEGNVGSILHDLIDTGFAFQNKDGSWPANSFQFSVNDFMAALLNLGNSTTLTLSNLGSILYDKNYFANVTLANVGIIGLDQFNTFDLIFGNNTLSDVVRQNNLLGDDTLSPYEIALKLGLDAVGLSANVLAHVVYPPSYFEPSWNTMINTKSITSLHDRLDDIQQGSPTANSPPGIYKDANGNYTIIQNLTLGFNLADALGSNQLGLNISKPMFEGLYLQNITENSLTCALEPVRNVTLADVQLASGNITGAFYCSSQDAPYETCPLDSLAALNTTWSKQASQDQVNDLVQEAMKFISNPYDPQKYTYGTPFSDGLTTLLNQVLEQGHDTCEDKPQKKHTKYIGAWLDGADIFKWIAVGFGVAFGLAFLSLPWIYGWYNPHEDDVMSDKGKSFRESYEHIFADQFSPRAIGSSSAAAAVPREPPSPIAASTVVAGDMIDDPTVIGFPTKRGSSPQTANYGETIRESYIREPPVEPAVQNTPNDTPTTASKKNFIKKIFR